IGNRYKLHEGGEWIDEGENGRPDLLDEAVWLLEYNRRARHILKDYGGTGGVPGYVGRDGIEPSAITAWMDTREWYISGNNPEATFLYAGNAAYYAINLNRFHELQGGTGNHPEYEEWMAEAVESYDWGAANTSGADGDRRAQGYAAAVLYRATDDPEYQSVFKDYWVWEPDKTHGEWAGVNLWAIAAMQHAMLPDDHPNLDTELQNSCSNNIVTRANSKADDIYANGFRNGMEYYQFLQLGGFNTPRLTVLGAAHRLTGDTRYLQAMQHAVSYVLGGNQLNMAYLSGLGERSDQWIFQPNAYLVSNKNNKVYTPENYIGQTSYFGATGLASNYWFTESKYAEYFSRQAAYPLAADPPSVWPGAEQKFQNRYSIQGGEFTIHQQMNHMIFAIGYINAMANTSNTPYSLAPRPEVSLNLNEGQSLDEAGCKLRVTASENTRRIEYYAGWRFIGENKDAENGFEFIWNPAVTFLDQDILITAVAFSDRGRRSLPTEEGMARIRISENSQCRIDDDEPTDGITFRLFQNYPNPFNLRTLIRFDLRHFSPVTISVYDMLGKKITTLIDEPRAAGRHSVTFDASGLASGIYIYNMRSDTFNQSKKMTLIK
ncbi:MAG: T9SS C-terminal target domain-containing protein, partial [Balneolaceae bacterium]